jgi:hypothetical protein
VVAPGGGWRDRLKHGAKQAATQGKALAGQAKAAVGEQQAKRTDQLANDPSVLWHGRSEDMTSKTTGLSKATYRITKERVWIDTGLLGVKSEQVPMWAIKDVDVRQSVLQRAKDIGDVALHLEDPHFSAGSAEPGRTSGDVLLDNIKGPYVVRDLLMPLMAEARAKKLEEQPHLVVIDRSDPDGHGPAAAQIDVADQLRKLATLRDEGILSDDEFAAQKAKLLSL